MLHILKDKFGWGLPSEAGFIFNMSVGYNLEGIRKPNVQWYLDAMRDCSAWKRTYVDIVAANSDRGGARLYRGARACP